MRCGPLRYYVAVVAAASLPVLPYRLQALALLVCHKCIWAGLGEEPSSRWHVPACCAYIGTLLLPLGRRALRSLTPSDGAPRLPLPLSLPSCFAFITLCAKVTLAAFT